MLLKNDILDAIKQGEISIVFRVWKRPTVKTGGTLTTRTGILFIDKVEKTDPSKVTEKDIRDAGLSSREELPALKREGDFYRIELHYHGEDPRIALRRNVDKAELRTVCEKLDKMGEWAAPYLRLIGEQPGVHAQILADSSGTEKKLFKGRLRRLKALGLTISLSPGYEVSTRGEAVLRMIGKS